MGFATVATVSVAIPVTAQIGDSRVLSRQSIVLAASKRTALTKLVCNRSIVVMRRYIAFEVLAETATKGELRECSYIVIPFLSKHTLKLYRS